MKIKFLENVQFVFSRQIRGRAKRSEVKRAAVGGAEGRAHRRTHREWAVVGWGLVVVKTVTKREV